MAIFGKQYTAHPQAKYGLSPLTVTKPLLEQKF